MDGASRIAGRRIGYIRVNTLCRDISGQLEGQALDRVFTDTIVRKRQFLHQFASMCEFLRDGDTLVVQQMDRLARSGRDFVSTVRTLTGRGIRVECLTEGLIFPAGATSPIRNVLLLTLESLQSAQQQWASEASRENKYWNPSEAGTSQ
ncbi:MAG: recombinase family protein [Gemmataceae bacterium]|nr:recombinase family protein [Gemmataceae bacterium]